MKKIYNIWYLTILLNLFYFQDSTSPNRCMLKALNIDSENNFLTFNNLMYIKLAMVNYQLMPEELVKEFKNCKINLQKAIQICNNIYGKDSCELCGMIALEKCKPGYERFSCGSCFKKCPYQTKALSFGLLCQKPKIYERTIYENLEECNLYHDKCKNNNNLILSECKLGFTELGFNLCLYICPKGYKDLGNYCLAPFYTQSDYYSNDFSDKTFVKDY